MSLVRHDERFRFERLEGVYFLMADGGVPILCKVSHEALRDRSARDGEPPACPTPSSATVSASRRSLAKNTRKATGPTISSSC